jgi:hypothetical protein
MLNKIISIITGIVIGAGASFLYSRFISQQLEPEAIYLETDSAKLIELRQDLDNLKSELKKKGLYSCCIKNDCNWCAIYMGHCPCARLVFEKGNEKSCPECAAAWNRKQGKFPGVDPDAIEVTTFGIYGFEEGHHFNKETSGHRHIHER